MSIKNWQKALILGAMKLFWRYSKVSLALWLSVAHYFALRIANYGPTWASLEDTFKIYDQWSTIKTLFLINFRIVIEIFYFKTICIFSKVTNLVPKCQTSSRCQTTAQVWKWTTFIFHIISYSLSNANRFDQKHSVIVFSLLDALTNVLNATIISYHPLFLNEYCSFDNIWTGSKNEKINVAFY